jgi:outer membrane receptor protein involved in Fe transport
MAAAQELHSFSVQDKDPASALRTFGAQAGIQVLASAVDLSAVKLNPVTGTMSTQQALSSLLAGSGLDYRYVSDVAIAVVPSAPARRVRISEVVDATATAAAAAPAPQSAGTESSPALGGTGQLEEIIVTATRRAEDITKVPISITAVTQAKIDTLGIKDFSDMAKYTPGVVVDTDRTNQITIRGIASTGGAATTGIYIDDTPVQTRTDIDPLPNAFDVERIEVLRGPQGTLFGAGAEGGAVRYITVQPSVTRTDIYSLDEVSYTQGGAINYELSIAGGGPIIDNVLGFRVTAQYNHVGGWVDRIDAESPSMMTADANPFANNATLVPVAAHNILDSNANRYTQKLLRVAMLWQPTQNWQITPSIYYQNKEQNDEDVYWQTYANAGNDQLYNGNPERVPTSDHFYLYALKVQGNLGFAQFISNTSYFDRYTASSYNGVTGTTYNLGFYQDLVQYDLGNPPNYDQWIQGMPWIDGRGIHLIGAPFPANFRYYAPAPTWAWFYNWTQEFRLQSNDTASKFQWTAGAFYELDQQIDQNYIYAHYDTALLGVYGLSVTDIFGEPLEVTNNPSAQTNSWDVWQNQYTRQYAVFVDASYAFTDQWKLDIGLRQSWIIYWFHESTSGSQEFGPSLFANGRNPESSFTPKASLNFQIDPNNLLYFTYAKGFRPGGANSPISYASCASDFQNLGLSGTPLSYKSDTTQSFELGTKNNINNRVQLATSVYYIRWNGIQQFALLPQCGIGFIGNLGQALSKGFDFQADFRLTNDLTFNLAVGYTEAYYTKDSKIVPTAPTDITLEGDSINGANLLPIPPWTGTVGLEYRFNAFSHQAFARADNQFISAPNRLSNQYDPNTTLYDPRNFTVPSYNQLNLRTGVTVGLWEIDAFVNNLLDGHSITTYGLTVPGPALATGLSSVGSQRPRTMGLTFIFRK